MLRQLRNVTRLGRLYFRFDQIVIRAKCYKVETIGDGTRAGTKMLAVSRIVNFNTAGWLRAHARARSCAAFIACAGAPDALELANAVARISVCATRILSAVSEYRTPKTHRAISIRVGMHVGRVLGAVLGTALVRGWPEICFNRWIYFAQVAACACVERLWITYLSFIIAATLPVFWSGHGRRAGDGANFQAGVCAHVGRVL